MLLGAKKKCNKNNMIQQYLFHGDHIQGHTHMTWTTSHFYGMISLDNDPTPLLGLIDVTCCPCHVCVSLNETPMI